MVEIVLKAKGRNALSTQLMRETRERIQAAGDAPILLTGDGPDFCAGLNLKEVYDLDLAGMTGFLDDLIGLVKALFHHPGPTVAAVNGHAIAGGCVLALCCDHRILRAEERVRIGLNEVALGLHFPPFVLRACAYRLPKASVEPVILGAGLYGYADALALGLVDAVSDDPWGDAKVWLAQRAALPRHAYADAKAALRGGVRATAAEEAAFRDEAVPFLTSPALKDMIRQVLKL